MDARLIAGDRLTRTDLAQFARLGFKLRIDIQELARAVEGYVIACDPDRLMQDDGFEQMSGEAKGLPAFLEYFMDDDDRFGVAVREISPEIVEFKLRWC